MTGDLEAAIQTLAADNARLCGIAEAADKLAKAVERLLDGDECHREVERAWDEYKVKRQGQ